MNKKLYVGNLDYTVTTEDLKAFFSEAGEVVDCIVLQDKDTGRSRGFGFVEFANEEDAKKAIEMFSGKDMKGRNLVVNEAREKMDR